LLYCCSQTPEFGDWVLHTNPISKPEIGKWLCVLVIVLFLTLLNIPLVLVYVLLKLGFRSTSLNGGDS